MDYKHKRFHDQTQDIIEIDSLHWNRHMILQVHIRDKPSIFH